MIRSAYNGRIGWLLSSASFAIGVDWVSLSTKGYFDRNSRNYGREAGGVQGFGSKLVNQVKLKRLRLVNRIHFKNGPVIAAGDQPAFLCFQIVTILTAVRNVGCLVSLRVFIRHSPQAIDSGGRVDILKSHSGG
jgi:hypothetical protein